MEQKKEYDLQFKIMFLGASRAGKSSMLQSALGDVFYSDYWGTVGVDHRIKFLRAFNKIIRLWIWDSSGDPRVQSLAETYFRHVDGAFICFDLTDMQSFQDTKKFVEHLRAIKINATIFLIGCKADLIRNRIVDAVCASALADELGLTYLEVSALEKINIEQAFMQLTQKLYFPVQLKKYQPVLEEHFNEYLKLHIQKNRSGLFATLAQNTTKEGVLKEEFKSSFKKFFTATSMDDVVEFCRKTVHIIERADNLFKHENPFWSKLTKSPLAKALRQTLDVLYSQQSELFGLSNLSELTQRDKKSAAVLT